MIKTKAGFPFTEVRITETKGKKGGTVDFGKGKRRQVSILGTTGKVDSMRIGDVTIYPPLKKPRSYEEQGRDITQEPQLKERQRDKFEAYKLSVEKWYEIPIIFIEGTIPVNTRKSIDYYIKAGVLEEKDPAEVKEYLGSEEYKKLLKSYKLL